VSSATTNPTGFTFSKRLASYSVSSMSKYTIPGSTPASWQVSQFWYASHRLGLSYARVRFMMMYCLSVIVISHWIEASTSTTAVAITNRIGTMLALNNTRSPIESKFDSFLPILLGGQRLWFSSVHGVIISNVFCLSSLSRPIPPLES